MNVTKLALRGAKGTFSWENISILYETEKTNLSKTNAEATVSTTKRKPIRILDV